MSGRPNSRSGWPARRGLVRRHATRDDHIAGTVPVMCPRTEPTPVTVPRLLTIGVFARRSRLSMKALRLYERIGLLSPVKVDPHTGYRWYSEDQLFTARLIVALRRLDMPLSDVAQVVSVPGKAAAEIVSAYWTAVERRVAAQRDLADRLRLSLLGGPDRFAEFDVAERAVPAQIVLAEKRSVNLRDLPAMISGATQRLTRLAATHGGVAGERLVIFHGEVNEDGDGPVEVCVPVGSASERTRSEPAHREAYVTVTKAQFEWPQILSAYDAVEHWIDHRLRAPSGPSREIYRSGVDPHTAAPTDEICDVAIPIK